MNRFLSTLTILLLCATLAAQETYQPASTRLFATKDGQELYLDAYNASPGSATELDGKHKPTIVFMFGGGFITGARNDKYYMPWFKMLNDAGYGVVSIDYRLGMKGVKTSGGVASAKAFRNAAQMAAEDLYSATAYLIEHGNELGIDPNNLVTSGSSAGAIAVLEADWLLNNGRAGDFLPEGFRYAGVMPFAGAIISIEGTPSYKTPPAPTAFFHGTKNGYQYNIFRYNDHSHEIASTFISTFPEQIRFLETNVIRGLNRIVDSEIDDPQIPRGDLPTTRKQLYN